MIVDGLREAARAVIDEVSLDPDATDAEGRDWYWLSGEVLEQLRDALAGPEWTSVDDALPDAEGDYLTCYAIHRPSQYQRYTINPFIYERSWDGVLAEHEPGRFRYACTHWMRIDWPKWPDPPEVDNG